MKIFLTLFFLFFLIITSSLNAGLVQVPNNKSAIILHDGFFNEGLPYRFMIEESKIETWGYGNWENKNGYANIWFSQQNVGRILTALGMIPKKTLKAWGVEDFNLGKKKSFKSSGSPAVVQLVTIGDSSCAVFISKFGESRDTNSRVRTGLDGFVCKDNDQFTVEKAINFLNCIELKGDGTSKIGKKVDSNCEKTNSINFDTDNKIKNKKTIVEDEIEKNNSVEERLQKLKNLFDKELISKEDYDAKKKEILDTM